MCLIMNGRCYIEAFFAAPHVLAVERNGVISLSLTRYNINMRLTPPLGWLYIDHVLFCCGRRAKSRNQISLSSQRRGSQHTLKISRRSLRSKRYASHACDIMCFCLNLMWVGGYVCPAPLTFFALSFLIVFFLPYHHLLWAL